MTHACLLAVVLLLTPPNDAPFPLELRPTSLLRAGADCPRAVLHATLRAPLAPDARVVVLNERGETLAEAQPQKNVRDEQLALLVPLWQGADPLPVRVRVVAGDRVSETSLALPVPEADWTLHFITGFHFDPVWWNTQAHYAETGFRLASHVGPGITLVRENLRLCREDSDYRVAFHQLPYLKTFIEAAPQEVAELRQRVADGRVAIVGGTYNELSTTLISAEAAARNAIYGTRFQRDVLGGDGAEFWQCDVFGHDPSFPSLMARTGHTGGAFARGPFHQWGAPRDQVNFPSEFIWMAPDGHGVMTHYMAGHYGYAYEKLAAGANRAPDDAAEQERLVAAMFEDLKRPALTRNVLLPMHMDFIRPLENLGEVTRRWNQTYVSPRAVISTPEDFFNAVRGEIMDRGFVPPVITRDMNPIYTGCAVSFADLKLAQRACETALRDAEIFATLAALEGAAYPSAALDRAWRQLLFNAHHDAVTGSMSDQVYLDVMYAYRDALELATVVRDRAVAFLASRIKRWSEHDRELRWHTTASAALPAPIVVGCEKVKPPPPADPTILQRSTRDQILLESKSLRVLIDLPRGGCITSIMDKRTGRELLRAPANDLVVYDEYETLPGHGEGPWHLAPTGKRRSGATAGAWVVAPAVAAAGTVTLESDDPDFRKRQTIMLRDDPPRIDFQTDILEWRGRSKLVRVEFPLRSLPLRPVFQTAGALLARPFARDVDAAVDPWTLDQSCWQWAGVGALCRLEAFEGDRLRHARVLGVAEIVIGCHATPDTRRAANRLAEAFVKSGVTSTITRLDQRRYSDLALDSNAPDFRVFLGTAADTDLLGALPPGPLDRLRWIEPDAGLPQLIVAPGEVLDRVVEDLAGNARIRVELADAQIARRQLPQDVGVVLVNHGSVSVHAREDGVLALNLLRSCPSWPAGVWIDGPPRRHPDGSVLELMHGSHSFRYSLLPFAGDLREAGLSRHAQALHHPEFVTPWSGAGESIRVTQQDRVAFVEIEPPDLLLMALKPAGFPEADWVLPDPRDPPPVEKVVARVWNSSGRRTAARLRVHRAADRAWRANLLEEEGDELAVKDGWVEFAMPPNDYATIVFAVKPADRAADAPTLDPAVELISPSAYWLENLGEANVGNGVLAIAPAARRIALADGAGEVVVRFVNNDRRRSADVRASLTAASAIDAQLDAADFTLAPGEFREAKLTLSRRGDQPTRESMVQILASTADGRRVSAALWIADGPSVAATPDVGLTAVSGVVAGAGPLRARLRNYTAGPIRGEAAWLSPMTLWRHTPTWRREVTIPPGESVELDCPLTGGAAPDSYALLRFTYGGRVLYSETVATVVDPQRFVLSIGVDRLRIPRGGAGRVQAMLRAVAGLAREAPVALTGPDGWTVVEREREWRAADAEQILQVRFDVTPPAAARDATLTLTGPRGQSRSISAAIVPVQQARRVDSASVVKIDGDLSDWRPEEFTEARGPEDVVRCAVRHGLDGLTLAFDVHDAVFAQPHAGNSIWRGDCVQIALTPRPVFSSTDGDVHEFGIAQTVAGAVVWGWVAGAGGQTGAIPGAAAAIVRDGAHTRYEAFIPSSAMPTIPLETGSTLGFAYAANDDDGEGFKGAIEWADGISGGKDASLYGDLRLVAP
ncbi:MAG: glycoside hydrolase family 38 C-terminal domain-containing protein [Phycisphaerae bacterium]